MAIRTGSPARASRVSPAARGPKLVEPSRMVRYGSEVVTVAVRPEKASPVA